MDYAAQVWDFADEAQKRRITQSLISQAIKVYHTPTGKDKPSYPKVKAWFLKTYPQYGKKEIAEKSAA